MELTTKLDPEQHHAVATNQNVLGTEIPMHQRLARGFNPSRLGIEERAQRRMPLSGGKQIGLNAKLVEIPRRIEFIAEPLVPGSAAMDFAQDAPGERSMAG